MCQPLHKTPTKVAPAGQEDAMPRIDGLDWWNDDINPDPGNHVSPDPSYQIYGYGGDDRLFGGDNVDFLDGGTGADRMSGGGRNDTYVVDNAGDVVVERESNSFGDGLITGGEADLVYASVSFTLGAFVENLSLLTGAGAINGTGNELVNTIHGNNSGNTLDGLDGADLLIGHGGSDTLRGGNHNDELYGSEDNDTLEGGAGSDTMDGGTGSDTMRGGAGDDSYFVDNGGDIVTENANEGHDTVYSSVTLTLRPNVEDLGMLAGAIDGTGNELDNVISGNVDGNDIRGLDGEDLLKGGGGDDELRGGNQNDELYGQGGDDELRGEAGDDAMFGDAGDDDYFVNSGGDLVGEDANEGLDAVFVTVLDNYTLTAHVENLHLLTGTNGTGNGLANYITGNLLDNTIDGAGGADTMEGRQGDDTYRVDNAGDAVNEFAEQGSDTVLASVSYTLTAGSSVETLATTNDAGTGTINLTGNAVDNSIRGNNGTNILNGGGGSDVIDGRGGTDTASYEGNLVGVAAYLGMNGTSGLAFELLVVNGQAILVAIDTLISIENLRGSSFDDELTGNELNNELRGGFGNDTYTVQNAGDTIVEFASQGTDEVRAGVSYTLTTGADVETLRTTNDAGTAAINLTGNGANNHVIGNNAGNTLDGGGGNNDELEGRDGDDTYLVNNANVTITEDASRGVDTVRTSVSYTLTTGADVELFTTNNDAGTAVLNLTGNASGNEVRGNNGNNVLNGCDGNDFLTGLGGQDQFLFSTALDAASNVDQIVDFTIGVDRIQLENAIFTAFAAGGVAADRIFVVGTGTQDANDNLVYNRAAGALSYDADGAGGAAAILFATMTPGIDLRADSFLIV
jgi:trimeric autotransporter adhesin